MVRAVCEWAARDSLTPSCRVIRVRDPLVCRREFHPSQLSADQGVRAPPACPQRLFPDDGMGQAGGFDFPCDQTVGMERSVRSRSASDRDVQMLQIVADYQGFSKSATITNLIRKEFWPVFPSGTANIKPDPHGRIRE